MRKSLGLTILCLGTTAVFWGNIHPAISAEPAPTNAAKAENKAEGSLEVLRLEICTGVENKSPQNSATSFKMEEVSKLYCFTETKGAKEPTHISHVWYYQDKQIVEVKLALESPRWRNWSSKTLLPHWRGNWKVEILDADGKLLKSIDFTVN